ncbi:MAG: polyribonucleotide nucleotidyltransferase [Candidatus Xiphinematobacter sp.]|nr:MAG: polyribonucleotide nucleotidyltransferase [Candidatus Xiphinematobacter sp.]
MAKLSDGAVTVCCGETIVLVSAVSSTTLKEGQDFFPLTVDYREKAAAAGKFPGGYFKREGRPTEKETLTSRMTDRPLRPLFPKGYFYDTQIISLLLSADGENDPDILSINGASAALAVSDIPFAGPIGAVRIGYVCSKFVVNPTHTQRAQSDLDLVYVGDGKNVIMIEGTAEELPESKLIAAFPIACEYVAALVDAQRELQRLAGKAKRVVPLLTVCDALSETVYQVAGSRIEAALYTSGKQARERAIGALREEVRTAVLAKYPQATLFDVTQAFDLLQKRAFRAGILDRHQRCDGRVLHQLRPISSEVGLVPRAHGSAMFQRGETQALALATLGTINEAQMIDAYGGGEESKRFILHYNFPPFSVGETGRMGGSSRREVGHGALAERSIAPVVPTENEFPYAIRISSEVMESNGSTSMAAVCSGTLALMDAGVPIDRPVAGISVGLVTEFADDGSLTRHATFTDIIGLEDHFGDMDFKLCGTSLGVTGFQLDLKLPGIGHEILTEAVEQAAEARTHILQQMVATISAPRAELNPHAPRIETIHIPSEKIGLLIGPGGKTIRGIVAESGAEINVEDDGSVRIYSNSRDSLQRAKEIIQGMVREVMVGEMYQGTVVSIREFGAFVEILPGKDGLVHISELTDSRVKRVEDVLSVGDSVWVQCIGIDEKGRVKLSRRKAMKRRSVVEAA